MLLKLALLGLARLSSFPQPLSSSVKYGQILLPPEMLSLPSMGLEMFKTLSSAVPLLAVLKPPSALRLDHLRQMCKLSDS